MVDFLMMIRRPLTLLLFSLTLLAAPEVKRPAPVGISADARIYVAPMEWQLDHYVIEEIRRQGLAVQVVSNASEADFVMTSSYQKLGSHLIAPGHYIQVTIVAANDGSAVWAGEVNDFAIVFGRLRRHGPRKAAEGIVKKLRSNLAGR
jgi:hypothetical protein